jgi:diguanylate cyclase (GGDEF)-like protein
MPFEKAKYIVSNKLDSKKLKKSTKGAEKAKQKEALKVENKKDVNKLKAILNKHAYFGKHLIDSVNYPGKEQDKNNFLNTLRGELHKIVQDNEATSAELQPLAAKLNVRSETLRKRFFEKQKAYDTAQYQKATLAANKDVHNAKFDDATAKLDEVYKKLSPLSRTAIDGYHILSRYNLDEIDLRLDLKIREMKVGIMENKSVYTNYIKKNVILVGRKGPNCVKLKADGQITLSEFQIDKNNGVKFGKSEKMHWSDFVKEVRENKYKMQQIVEFKNEFGETKYHKKNFIVEEKENEKLNKEKAQLAEIKALKQINELYLFQNEAMQNLSEAEKKSLKKAFEENLNKHVLYFSKTVTAKGISIRPTDEFAKAGKYLKQQILQQMINGIVAIRNRLQLENKIETEQDPVLKNYYRAEVLMSKGLYMKANFYYRKFLGAGDWKKFMLKYEDIEKIANAKKQLKATAFKLLNLAKRHLAAVHSKLTKKEYNAGLSIINGAEQELQNDPSLYDFTKAVRKHSYHWDKISYGADNSSKKNRLNAVAFIFGLIKALDAKSPDGVLTNILDLGRVSRKAGFTDAAATVFKEVMDEEVQEHKDAILKNYPSLYRNKLKEFSGKATRNIQLLDGARKYAVKMCGKDWETMEKTEKRNQILYYTNLFVKQQIDTEMNNFATKRYLKDTKGKTNAAAKEYVDMYNYFDNKMPWKWSDKMWENISEQVFVEGTIMFVTGGAGMLAGGLVRNMLLKKVGGKLLPRLLSYAAAGIVDISVDTLTEAGLRTMMTGKNQFTKKNLKENFVHQVGINSVMGGVNKFAGRALAKITPYKHLDPKNLNKLQNFLQKAIPQTVSMTALQAPTLAAFQMIMPALTGDSKAQISLSSFAKNYANSLRDIVFVSAGQKFANFATGGIIPKMGNKLELRAKKIELKSQLTTLKNSSNLEMKTKGKLLTEAMKSGKLSNESLLKLSRSKNLKANQIIELRKFVKNPTNADLLLLIKNSEKVTLTKDRKKIVAKLKKAVIANMKKMGLKVGVKYRQAMDFINSLSVRDIMNLRLDTVLVTADGRMVLQGKRQQAKGIDPVHKQVGKPNTKIDISRREPIRKSIEVKKATSTKQELATEKFEKASDKTKNKAIQETMDHLAITIDGGPKVRETFFDKMTGLMNRNGLSKMEAMLKEGKKLSLMSYDADHFKAYNEIKGEVYGDKIIKLIGKNMNDMISKLRKKGHDVYGVRMGGEEIVIFGTVPKDVLHKQLNLMTQKLKVEIRSTLTAVDLKKMTDFIANSKYRKNIFGKRKAMREIGGSTAAVVEVDGSKISNHKNAAKKIIMMADTYLEHMKNKKGRGNLLNDSRSAKRNSLDLVDFTAKNELNKQQNVNLQVLSAEVLAKAKKQFDSHLKVLNGLKLKPKQRTQIEALLKSPGNTGKQVSDLLKQFGVKGTDVELRKLQKKLQDEYFNAIRDHGNYTGASTMLYLERALSKPDGVRRFDRKNVRNIEIKEFKSINETLGHNGGDMILTIVSLETRVAILKKALKKSEIPSDHFMIVQKGSNFRYVISNDFIAKHPDIQTKVKDQLKIAVKATLKQIYAKIDVGISPKAKKYSEIRSEWIKKNKQATTEKSLKDQGKISVTKVQNKK